MEVRSNEAYFLHSVQLSYLTQFHHLKCHVAYMYYYASESHRQRCIADGAIKETDWTPALAKSARRQSDWSCSRLALHILRGARCREHSADPESRSRSDATSAQPSRCRRHHPLTRESRRGVAQARERERERSRALSGSANPSSIKGSTYRIIFGRFILPPLWAYCYTANTGRRSM